MPAVSARNGVRPKRIPSELFSRLVGVSPNAATYSDVSISDTRDRLRIVCLTLCYAR